MVNQRLDACAKDVRAVAEIPIPEFIDDPTVDVTSEHLRSLAGLLYAEARLVENHGGQVADLARELRAAAAAADSWAQGHERQRASPPA